jgi:prepilin peptidase CpaA
MTSPPNIALACALLTTLAAAISDGRLGIIPNSLTLPPILLAPAAYGVVGGSGSLFMAVAAAILCGLAPYVLFRVRAMGGGDVKLFAALGAIHGHDVLAGLRIQFMAFAFAMAGVFFTQARERRLMSTLSNTLRYARDLVCRRASPRDLNSEETSHVRLGAFVLAATLVQTGALLVRLWGQ